jgi:hypothetical protein
MNDPLDSQRPWLFESLPIELHVLPDGVTARDVERRTRSAARAFFASNAHRSQGWRGRTKLRSWLIVEYGMATEWTREDDACPWLRGDAWMDEARARLVLEDARARVTRLLVEESAAWSDPGFAAEMVDRGLLTKVIDAHDREAFAPAARAGLSLLERVASVFIADVLAHPEEYAVVSACACCGGLRVGARATHARTCATLSPARPPPESGVRLRPGASTTAARAAFVEPLLPAAPPLDMADRVERWPGK